MQEKNKIKYIKFCLLFIMTVIVLTLSYKSVYAITQNEVQTKLDSIVSQYNGTYWTNDGKPATSLDDSKYYYGWQCKGFANWVFYQLFGVQHIGPYVDNVYYYLSPVSGATEIGRLSSSNMSVESAKTLLKKGAMGDFIQVRRRGKNYGHYMILYSVSDTGIKVLDCNSDGKCGVRFYNISWNEFYNSNESMSLYRANGYTPSTSYNPEGNLDVLSAGTGTVRVSGWAFDRDAPTKSIYVDIYVGGPAGDADASGYRITAGNTRTDVGNNYPGMGNNHGFDTIIHTTKTGNQDVYVYLINEGGGANTLLAKKTVNIAKDTIKPQISKVWVQGVDAYGYMLNVDFSDNVGVKKVRCATWTNTNGQNDIKWDDMTLVSGNRAALYVKFADHGTNIIDDYVNHIYVYDYSGNSTLQDIIFSRYKDLGDEFYARINNVGTGKKMRIIVSGSQATLDMASSSEDTDQLWKFEKQADRSYKIISCQNGYVLGLEKSSSNAGIALVASKPGKSLLNTQKWYLSENVSGYNLMPACSIGNAATTDMKTALITDANKTQIFTIDKVTNLSKYQPSITGKAYKDSACKTEADSFDEGTTVYIKIEYRNMPKCTVSVNNSESTYSSIQDINTSVKVIAIKDLKNGTYNIKFSGSNYLNKTEKQITISVKSKTVTPTPSQESGIVSVANTVGTAGSTVAVPISITKNPGIIAAQYELGYDASKLKLIKVEDEGLLDSPFMSEKYTSNLYILSWGDGLLSENISKTGIIATAYFEILDNADGKAEVTLKYQEAYDKDLKEVKFETKNGTVEIQSYVTGDVNNDGKVMLNDALLLRRYISGEDVDLNINAADVNQDGSVKLQDAILLRRYVAGWDVVLG